jgi:hypothetical protein
VSDQHEADLDGIVGLIAAVMRDGGNTMVQCARKERAVPSSHNRRRVEIPTELYARVSEEALRAGTSVSALTTLLLADALDRRQRPRQTATTAPDAHAMLLELSDASQAQLHALDALRRQVGALEDALRESPLYRAGGTPLASTQRHELEAARDEVISALRRERRQVSRRRAGGDQQGL